MKSNLFLTGRPGAGKTTIIKRVIEELHLVPGGFMVGREGKKGKWTSFYLVDAREFLEEKEEILKGVFAWREDPEEKWQLNPGVFDSFGSRLLKRGYKRRLIIMDELGRFEINSFKFIEEVRQVLDRPQPVLGVIKDEENPFLNKIRKRNDLDILRVNKENREKIYRVVLEWVNYNVKN